MKASEFHKLFDEGECVIPYAEMDKAYRPNKMKRINIDFPAWMVESIDNEAQKIGITRQSLIKVWISNCLKEKAV